MFARRLALAGLIPILASCASDSMVGPSAPRAEPSTIVFGSPDVANTYSNVAAVIARAPNGRFSPFCTGTLIAPTVGYLTFCFLSFTLSASLGLTATTASWTCDALRSLTMQSGGWWTTRKRK